MGLDRNMQLVMSGVLNVTQLFGVLSSLWTLDRFGRRKILMCGSVGMLISHLIIAVLVGLYSDSWPANRDKGWASVALLLFYMVAFGASWGPVPWAMRRRSAARPKCSSSATARNAVTCLNSMSDLANPN